MGEEEDGTSHQTKATKKQSHKANGRESFPGGGRRGVSSGLSTVVKRIGAGGKGATPVKSKPKTKEKWWTELGGGGSKGSIRLKKG